MPALIHLVAGLGVLACAAIYGGDLFAAIVLRSALSDVDVQSLTTVMGRIHRYGDRRMPILFVVSVAANILDAILAFITERTVVVAVSAVATVALLCWIVVFLRVSAPVNRALTAAANAGTTLCNARALQRRWNLALPARLSLQAVALAALCAALALA